MIFDGTDSAARLQGGPRWTLRFDRPGEPIAEAHFDNMEDLAREVERRAAEIRAGGTRPGRLAMRRIERNPSDGGHQA